MFFCSSIYAIPADVDVICGREYFSAVHEALKNAKVSIEVVLYFINFDPGKVDNVSILVNDLVEAHRRGVKVKVILDRNKKFGKHGLVTENYYVEEKNKRVFEFLKNIGIEVYYDSKNVTTHAKTIVVD